jgi:hypothetical protein
MTGIRTLIALVILVIASVAIAVIAIAKYWKSILAFARIVRDFRLRVRFSDQLNARFLAIRRWIQRPPELPAVPFQQGWKQIPLPIFGIVSVIDRGNPGVGLSAMQMYALGVRRGMVLLEFNGRTCESKVWNAYGPNATGHPAEIRITNSVARILHCGIDDEVRFVKVLTPNLPTNV